MERGWEGGRKSSFLPVKYRAVVAIAVQHGIAMYDATLCTLRAHHSITVRS